ncbi:MAG TPA: alpha/beta hydrolase family protein [Longimicrobiales bacterium]|nr:alpha/beta hydrolase family protein [Longimicrobiales bacterium]
MIRPRAASLLLTLAAALLSFAPPAQAQQGGRVLEGRTLFSKALNREWAYTIYLPPDYERSERAYPVFYLLHGMGGEHTNWARYGDAQMTADSLIAASAMPPAILVMPDGKNSSYVDSDPATGYGAMETALVQDLIPHIDATYRTIPTRRARMIGGLSMGGYGAIHTAFKHPELFGAAATLSGGISRTPPQPTEPPKPPTPWGIPFDAKKWQAESPFTWIPSLKEKVNDYRLQVYIGTGDDDDARIVQGAVDLYNALRLDSLPAELRITDGAHTWEVWDRGLKEALIFFSNTFRARIR